MSEAARKDITTQQAGQVIAADADALSAFIIRAASDPNVDIDKLERLIAMRERISARDAETAFNGAMNAAQAEMRPIATDLHNAQTKSRYASFAALDRALRPIYTAHGFSLSYDTGEGAPQDFVRIVCHVAHAEGHTRSYHVDMPADGKGAKGGDVMTKTHATGAAMTYGQRYLLKLIFNIAVGEDSDGNAEAPANGRKLSQAVQDAFAEINACEGWPALERWRDTKSADYRPKVSNREWQEIIDLFNRRTEACGG